MKKRKELNALIGLGESKRKKTKKGSGHRLLRTEPPGTESESSSDDDEFNNLGTVAAFGKRSYTQCCNMCYPLFLFIILAACVMACGGLIWMQIALKEDLDSLKEKLHTLESSQKVSSHEIPKLSEDLKTRQRQLEDIESGDKGLNKLWTNLTEMNRKISLLDTAVNHLKANIKSASDLISLPTTVEELQKSVATIGSTLTSVQHDVKTMQAALEEQRKETDGLKQTMDDGDTQANAQSTASPEKDASNFSSLALNTDVADLREVVSEVNKSQELFRSWTDRQILSLRSSVSNLTQKVSSLEQASAQTAPYDSVEIIESENIGGEVSAMVPDNRTGGSTTETIQEKSTPSTGSKPTRRPRFLTPSRAKRDAGTRKTLVLPGVRSLKDLEVLFQRSESGATSQGMSYQDLRDLLGPATPDSQILESYDQDGNRRYSLAELKAAVSL
ncbi:EF-hand calcium-binding domain-containing protein 14 isoform X1 [Hypomesus transpacificus]|uniref:EF-hand calcium-binding domain-containing protein 14 isoform X1 n=1 Tax=Hypomesus transpacificus TaxID=137520 RepID=UPI001F07B08D|nr:EF-hand calcium-binding domain-containing protein 14 isoform X1 [Hypomesus transpacificus]